jgi:proliferating cell nuclear antigen PCNA
MELVPKDSAQFRSSIDAMKEFLPQAQFRISDKGLCVRGMDASHVGFTDYCLSASDCTSLQCSRPLVIGLNTDTISRVLNPVGTHDALTLATKDDSLVISYTNEKLSKRAVYTIPTLTIDEDALDLPTLTYEACIVAKTSDIVSAMKEVSHFGDSLHFRLDEGGFHISASGTHGKVCQTLENTDDRDMSLGSSDTVEASFGTRYVMAILKGGAPLSTTMKIEFEPSQPARFTFQFGSASYFVGYLAPKVFD